MNGEGRVFQRGAVFWIAYYVHGKEYRESGGRTERQALRKLQARMGEKHADSFVGPEQERLTVADLLESLTSDLERRGAKAIASHRCHVKPIRLDLGDERAAALTTKRLESFVAAEREKQKSPASINRELAALRAAFHLGRKQGRISRVPYFPMLREDNVRQGFFEKDDFESVESRLPEVYSGIARFAYVSGWRKGEITNLTWENVDRSQREVRISTSKNGHGRVLPLEGQLRDLIERRWACREFRTADGVTAISHYVFHVDGRKIVDFRKTWANACRRARVPGRLFHDLRRTAVRNMIRAGVPQTVAMSISGHRTISMFNRYNITSDADKREALLRTQAHLGASGGASNVAEIAGHGQNTDISAHERRTG